MAPSNPLANWERLGDSFYRKVPIYDAIFDEDIELENYIIAGAPYGGAIGKDMSCCREPRLHNYHTFIDLQQHCTAMKASRIGSVMLKPPSRVLTSIRAPES